MALIDPLSRSGGQLPRTAIDLALLARPGLQPAVLQAFGVLALGQGSLPAIAAGTQAFLATPAGQQFGPRAAEAIKPMLETAAQHPFVARNWGALKGAAARPGYLSGLVAKNLPKELGAARIGALGTFTEDLMKTATTKGLGEAIRQGSKAAPGLLKLLGKFARFLPGVGLGAALLFGLKTLADPGASAAQKLAAVLNIGAGAAGLIPGLGTAAQLAITGGSTAVGLVADAGAKKKGWA